MTTFFNRTHWAALVIAAAAAPVAQAQTVANGPYYATPSWSQKIPCDTAANCPRFVVLANWNNEAVLDRETGLVWERSPSTSEEIWSNAFDRCIRSNVGGRAGWRLPTIWELYSLIDRSLQQAPLLPMGHPFTVSGVHYWSTTRSPNQTSALFLASTNCNSCLAGFNPGNPANYWCVRGGAGN